MRNLVSDVVDGVGKLLGIGGQPDPSATPSTTAPADPAPTTTPPAPAASPTPAPPADPTPAPRSPTAAPKPTSKSTPTPSPSPTCAAVKRLAAPADNIKAAVDPAEQITAKLAQVNLTFDGVTPLPTANGTIQVLQFSIDSSESTPFELRVPMGNGKLDYRSSDLTVSGHVRFYTSRLQGTLQVLGLPLLPVNLTPGDPLSLVELSIVPPGSNITFVDVDLDLVLVRADKLTASGLGITHL